MGEDIRSPKFNRTCGAEDLRVFLEGDVIFDEADCE